MKNPDHIATSESPSKTDFESNPDQPFGVGGLHELQQFLA